MGVPTIYAKLLESSRNSNNDSAFSADLGHAVQSSKTSIRLMVSGSMALPTKIMKEWETLTGHVLLERYGMTEFAMALSNPYSPLEGRLPGYVGQPLPSVQVRIVKEDTKDDADKEGDGEKATGAGADESECVGELRVKGPTVFTRYWNQPEATKAAFDSEGYFKTGDIVQYSTKYRSYRVLGRASVDIIKCGGYKLSALEIERVLIEHEDVEEMVVLGVPDLVWGERVAAICRMKQGATAQLTLESLRQWCQTRLTRYKIPSRLLVVEEIPKNAMGKVSKKQLVSLFHIEGNERGV